LFEYGVHLILKFIDLFALGFEDGIFLFQESQIGPEKFLDSIGMFIKFRNDSLAPGTSFLTFRLILALDPIEARNVASLSHEC
jgi:hypothetical protein